LSLLISNFSLAMEEGQFLSQQDVMEYMPEYEDYYFQEQDKFCWYYIFSPVLSLSLLSLVGSIYKIPYLVDSMDEIFLIVIVCLAITNIYGEYVLKRIGKMKDMDRTLLKEKIKALEAKIMGLAMPRKIKTLEEAAQDAGLDSKFIDKLQEFVKAHPSQAYDLESID